MFKYLNQWMDFIGSEYHVNIKTFLKFSGGKRFTFIRKLSFTGAYLRLNLLNLINYAWQDDARKSMIFHFAPTICLCLSIDRRNDLFVCFFISVVFFIFLITRIKGICSQYVLTQENLQELKRKYGIQWNVLIINRVPINLEHLRTGHQES